MLSDAIIVIDYELRCFDIKSACSTLHVLKNRLTQIADLFFDLTSYSSQFYRTINYILTRVTSLFI